MIDGGGGGQRMIGAKHLMNLIQYQKFPKGQLIFLIQQFISSFIRANWDISLILQEFWKGIL